MFRIGEHWQHQGIRLFGVNVHLVHLPLWFLVLILPALPFIRENFPFLWNSQSIRPLTAFASILFIALSLIFVLKEYRLYINAGILSLLGLFWGVTALSTALSDIPWQGSAHLMEMLVYILMGVLLYHQLHNAPQFRWFFSISLMVMLTLMILRFLNGWFSVYDPVNHLWSIQIAFAENIRHIGYLAAMLLPIGYSFLIRKNSHICYVLTLLYLTMAWGLVFWMGGRATFLALIGASFLFCLKYPRTILGVLVSAIAGLLISQLFTVTDPSLNLIRLFNIAADSKDLNQLSSFRLDMYQQSLQIWWSNAPWLGMGSDVFRYLRPAILSDYTAQPHSVVVQTAMSSGLIGSALLALITGLLVYAWFKNRHSPTIGLTAAGLAAIATGLIDGVFYHSLSFFTISIIIALSLPPTTSRVRRPYITRPVGGLLLLSLLYFSVFSWQLHLSRQPIPSIETQNWISRYPLYINAAPWLTQANEDEQQQLATMAVRISATPCRYASYLPDEARTEFSWCVRSH